MRITALVMRPGQWRLLPGISGGYLASLEDSGWLVLATWPTPPSLATVFAEVRPAWANLR